MVFDTSPVVNGHYVLTHASGNAIYHIHETEDELTTLANLVLPKKDREGFVVQQIPTTPPKNLQHGSTRLAVGMARFVAECQQAVLSGKRRSCGVPASDRRAADIYCKTFGSRTLDSRNNDAKACQAVYESQQPDLLENPQ